MCCLGALAAAAVWLVAGALTGCGGGGGAQPAAVAAGRMPEGGSFHGVWFSPQYGRIDVVQHGETVLGEYRKDEREGTIQGRAEGNLLRFEWTERRALISNRPTVTKGHGYFRYVVDPGTDEHKIMGRWGLGDDDSAGGPWNAVKSTRLEPELKQQGEAQEDAYGDEDAADDEAQGQDGLDVDDIL